VGFSSPFWWWWALRFGAWLDESSTQTTFYQWWIIESQVRSSPDPNQRALSLCRHRQWADPGWCRRRWGCCRKETRGSRLATEATLLYFPPTLMTETATTFAYASLVSVLCTL
jgi:hypothetical protein